MTYWNMETADLVKMQKSMSEWSYEILKELAKRSKDPSVWDRLEDIDAIGCELSEEFDII